MFDDMIPDMTIMKKRCPVVTELFIRGGKLNFFGVHHTYILASTKRCKPRYGTLLYHEDSKKARN